MNKCYNNNKPIKNSSLVISNQQDKLIIKVLNNIINHKINSNQFIIC